MKRQHENELECKMAFTNRLAHTHSHSHKLLISFHALRLTISNVYTVSKNKRRYAPICINVGNLHSQARYSDGVMPIKSRLFLVIRIECLCIYIYNRIVFASFPSFLVGPMKICLCALVCNFALHRSFVLLYGTFDFCISFFVALFTLNQYSYYQPEK